MRKVSLALFPSAFAEVFFCCRSPVFNAGKSLSLGGLSLDFSLATPNPHRTWDSDGNSVLSRCVGWLDAVPEEPPLDVHALGVRGRVRGLGKRKETRLQA